MAEKKTVLIAGYYGFGNVGDEAILSAILTGFKKQRKNLDFIVISSNPSLTEVEHGVRSVGWKDINGLLEAARGCSLVVLGGGGIFQDYWGLPKDAHLTQNHWGITYYSSIGLLAHLYGKPFMIYSAGVGPLFSDEGKYWTRLTFELANIATVRDSESHALLTSLGVPTDQVRVKPDPGFNLVSKKREAIAILEAAGVDLHGQPFLGVCLRNWTNGGKSVTWKQELASALDLYIKKYKVQVVFIPFQIVDHELENDHAVALELINMMTEKEMVHIISSISPPEVMSGIISHCHILLGMRLHSLIFSIGSGVPAVALAYDSKVHNLMRLLQLSAYTLDVTTLKGDELVSALETVMNKRTQIHNSLITHGKDICEQAQENTTLALKLLDRKYKYHETEISKKSLRDLLIRKITILTEQEARIAEQEARIAEQEARIAEQEAQVETLQEKVVFCEHEIDHLRWQVAYEQQKQNEILNSRVYKIAHKLRELRLFLLPPGGRSERVLRWLYRKVGEVIVRLREAIRRHGFFKAMLRGVAILGIRLTYPIKKILFKRKFERELRQLEQVIAKHQGFFDVFHVPMGWNTLLFQRFQHISLQTAKMGGLALYGGHPTVDKDIFVFQEVKKNLFVFKATDTQVTDRVLAALEKRKDQTVVLRIQSIDLVTTANDVQNFLQKGFTVIYEYIDEISPEITGTVPELVYQRHKAIIEDERVVVVATSDQLFEEVRRHRSQNYVLSTNGVDVDYWRIPKGNPPDDLKPALTGRIIVGYHGALARWTDYNLLRMIADEGGYELVLIGHEHDDEFPKSGLKEHPRVHYLGSKSYFELNSYAVFYDVAILPFRKNDLTQAVSPVKIFEYMAALKPIVSTDLRECRKYKSCLIAETNEEFLVQLKHAYEIRNDEEYIGILNKEAEENSWFAKTTELLRLAGVNL